jgi:hypothetical protein
VVSIAFSCHSQKNIEELQRISLKLAEITEARGKVEKLAGQELRWHITEESERYCLRVSTVLPGGFSMNGAGLLRTIGVNDMCLNIDFGVSGSSRLGFRAEVNRTTALVDDLLSNKDMKHFYRFFLNYFCGAVLKFQFSCIEEAIAHTIASPLLKIQESFVENLLQSGYRLTSNKSSTAAHMDLLQLILLFFGNHSILFDILEAAWLAIEEAKEDIEQISSISVVVGNELFQVDMNIPHLKLFSYTSLFLPNGSNLVDNNTE